MEEKKVRVRFAPSPTGPLHMGGVRTALYNYLFAKKHNGVFVLRIEDTDQTRYVEGAEHYIVDALSWCEMTFDEGPGIGGDFGPYRQSERKEIYRSYIDKLLKDGTAYYAFDTPEELNAIRIAYEADKKTFTYNATVRDELNNSLNLTEKELQARLDAGIPYTIRIKTPTNEQIRFEDAIKGWVVFESNILDDKILFKADGLPTYHFANVVDDYLMKISHVIRGEEWLPSAPCHVLLYRYLGWETVMPTFAHLPLILKPTGKGKLSKRDGDIGGFPVFPLNWTDPATGDVMKGFREEGYDKKAFINILAFLGWNPGTEQEIFSKEELIEVFELDRIGKSGAKFDPDKAKWFNQEYVKATPDEQLASRIQSPDLGIADDVLAAICKQMKERVTFAQEIITEGDYFFNSPTSYDAKMVKKKWNDRSPATIEGLSKEFAQVAEFNATNIEHVFKSYLETNEIGFGMGMIALRLVVTGKGGGPSLFHIMEIIGKEESLKRMSSGIEKLAIEAI